MEAESGWLVWDADYGNLWFYPGDRAPTLHSSDDDEHWNCCRDGNAFCIAMSGDLTFPETLPLAAASNILIRLDNLWGLQHLLGKNPELVFNHWHWHKDGDGGTRLAAVYTFKPRVS
jgi:hypothetical protein